MMPRTAPLALALALTLSLTTAAPLADAQAAQRAGAERRDGDRERDRERERERERRAMDDRDYEGLGLNDAQRGQLRAIDEENRVAMACSRRTSAAPSGSAGTTAANAASTPIGRKTVVMIDATSAEGGCGQTGTNARYNASITLTSESVPASHSAQKREYSAERLTTGSVAMKRPCCTVATAMPSAPSATSATPM